MADLSLVDGDSAQEAACEAAAILKKLDEGAGAELSDAEFVELLHRLAPDLYADRPLDPRGGRLLTVKPDYERTGDDDPEPSIAVYAERHELGYALYHPGDVFAESLPDFGVIVHRLENGADVCGDFVALRRRAA